MFGTLLWRIVHLNFIYKSKNIWGNNLILLQQLCNAPSDNAEMLLFVAILTCMSVPSSNKYQH